MTLQEVLFSLALFILGLAVSHFYYRRSTKKLELSWAHHITKIGSIPRRYQDKIRLMHGRKSISRPTSTLVYIWNSGNQTLNGSDLPSSHQLCISANGSNIREPKILRNTNSANRTTLNAVSPQMLSLDFDYFDPGDGITIEFLTDAGPNASGVEVTGTIKGKGALQGRGEYLWFYAGSGALPGKIIHGISALVFTSLTAIFAHNVFLNFDLRASGTYSDIVSTTLFVIVAVATIWTLPSSLKKIGQPEPPDALVDRFFPSTSYDEPSVANFQTTDV